MRRVRGISVCATLVALAATGHVRAQPPDGLGVLRVLGSRAPDVFAPKSGTIGALVDIPSDRSAASLGLVEIVPGIGRIRGSATQLLAFGAAHPDLHVELGPPLHTLLANAEIITRASLARFLKGVDGTGTAVGVVDTGLDVTLPDFRDPKTQKSRVAWMLDLSMKPLGLHAALETQFGIQDSNGNLIQGAVLTGEDIDTLISQANPVPIDPNGHGTHVTSIAAGNGGGTPYIGMAPNASLIIVRATRDASGSFENDDVINGLSFVYDRAAALGVPVAANMSIGTDFGPHDGNSAWERSLAGFVGSGNPGRALVAAAGNSGSIIDTPVHQAMEVTGARVRVPIITSATDGSVQVWVALRGTNPDVRVGLDGPDGTWVSPLSNGQESAHNSSSYQSGVIFGSGITNSPIPQGSTGAVVVWSGSFAAGTYAVTLEGHGYADLYLAPSGDAALPATYFTNAVRDATVTLPGSNQAIIAVGCTVDSPTWTSALGQKVGITEPLLDSYGGMSQNPAGRAAVQDGEICYFSSAGPNLLGVPKPDIIAPGGIVIGAMSQQALPGTPSSIFTTDCPDTKTACSSPQECTGGFQCGPNGFCTDPNCSVIDSTHAVASGTSMSSPMVTGIAALLFQQDPTLTQDVVRALLQAGAHKPRGPTPFFDQQGPGEVDALGALDALAESTAPDTALPDAGHSWMTVSEDFALADGSTPVTAVIELRTMADTRATVFDASRLQASAVVDGVPLPTNIVRASAPGLFTFTVSVPGGFAGQSLVFGATFDGVPIVSSITIPVALDSWSAGYPPASGGGCNTSPTRHDTLPAGLFGLALLALRRRAR
jgi:subtilisin family serine protease